MSSSSSHLKDGGVDNNNIDDPGQFVSGLTEEQVKADAEIAEFLRANFQTTTNNNNINNTATTTLKEDGDRRPVNGIYISPEILHEFGVAIEEEDADADAATAVATNEKMYGDPRIDAGLGTLEQQALNIRVLKTFARTQEGTRACVRMRNPTNGPGQQRRVLIPGIVYGADPTLGINNDDSNNKILVQTPWSELQRELDRFHRRIESRVYDLTVYQDDDDDDTKGGSSSTVHRVILRNVQRHPVQGKIYCANFLRYHPGRPIQIPLQYVNQEESPALKRDGFIVPVRKHVECWVEDGVRIPDYLEVECTGLVLKDVIRMDRVVFPDGVKVTDRVDVANFIVGPVQGGRSAAMGDDDDGGEGDAGEAATKANS